MLVNLSPFPLKVGVDSSNKNVNAGQIAIFPLDPGDAPARYRVDAVGNNGSATVANSAYRVDNNSRLIMVVIPDRHAQGNAPVSLRLLTDSVQMKAAPDPDAPR